MEEEIKRLRAVLDRIAHDDGMRDGSLLKANDHIIELQELAASALEHAPSIRPMGVSGDMSKWATIDREKLEREIERISAVLEEIGREADNPLKMYDSFRMLAEHNALVSLLNCLSPDAPIKTAEGAE